MENANGKPALSQHLNGSHSQRKAKKGRCGKWHCRAFTARAWLCISGVSQQRNCCSKPGRVISSSASSLGPGKSSEDPAQMPPIVLTFVFSLSTLRPLLTSPCWLLHPLSLLHPNTHKTSLQFRQCSARLSFLLCDLVTCPLSEFLHDQGHPSLHFQGLSWVNS